MRTTQPTQAEVVMDYLKARSAITAATASSVLGIPRLAAVINRLKKADTAISTTYVNGFKGRYAEYSLAT